MVLVTGWGGFYLGSMQSGISSVQRGLLDALLGIGLVSAGAGALNEALERKTDARMIRTANRPLASGRFSLAQGIVAGLGALFLGAVWLLLHTNLLTVALALLTAFTYVAIYTPLKRVTTLATFIGAFPGAWARCLAGPPHAAASSGPASPSSPSSLSGSSPLHGHLLAVPRRLRARRHSHVARRAARRLVHRRRGALLRRVMIPVSLTSMVLGVANIVYAVLAVAAGPALSRLHQSASPAFCAPKTRPRAACWRATCSKSACSICPCSSPRSCSAPKRSPKESRPKPKESMTHELPTALASRHPAPARPSPPFWPSARRPPVSLLAYYVHPAAAASSDYAFLPALNAVLNGLSATALLIGYTFIRAHRIKAHRAAMITAFAFSTLFLVSYIAHHALHGDVRYPLHAPLRMVYLPLLASHIILAVVALPLVLVTFFFSLTGRIPSTAKSPAGPSHSGSTSRHRRHHLRDAPPGAPRRGIVAGVLLRHAVRGLFTHGS
jgi:uncharacterized membrane protein YozB (DUF420 family)